MHWAACAGLKHKKTICFSVAHTVSRRWCAHPTACRIKTLAEWEKACIRQPWRMTGPSRVRKMLTSESNSKHISVPSPARAAAAVA